MASRSDYCTLKAVDIWIPGVLYGLYSVDSVQKVFDERNASIIGVYGLCPFSGSH